jgi:hypothetical protein
MGCGLGPFPFPNVATSVEACDKKQTRKTWGGLARHCWIFSSFVTLHAGLGFIFSHLNPATKFSLQLLLAQQPSNYPFIPLATIDVQHKIICQKRVYIAEKT